MKKVIKGIKSIKGIVSLSLLVVGLNVSAWDFSYKTANTMYVPQSNSCERIEEDVFYEIFNRIQSGKYGYIQGKVTFDNKGSINGYGNQIQVGVRNGVPMIINVFSDATACKTIIASYYKNGINK